VTYIIAEPCIDIKDKSCVDVCPVDCIHEANRILVIDPEECIDCFAAGEQFVTPYGLRTFGELEPASQLGRRGGDQSLTDAGRKRGDCFVLFLWRQRLERGKPLAGRAGAERADLLRSEHVSQFGLLRDGRGRRPALLAFGPFNESLDHSAADGIGRERQLAIHHLADHLRRWIVLHKFRCRHLERVERL